ncbi:MAG: PAS domain-containing protein, partial [Ilumatobacter sp.]
MESEQSRRALTGFAEIHRQQTTTVILDPTPFAVVTMNGSGRIVGWDLRAEELFGWSHADAFGEELAE